MTERIITVEQGALAGEVKGNCMIFKGVPYAKPPVNELRFKSPRPAEKWEGVRPAKEDPKICPQLPLTEGFYGREFYTDLNYPIPEQSEDCLYLNIWAPSEKPRNGGFPVALWIHGGAFDHGFSTEMEFDGKAFVNRDCILVTVNYRVGIFGFLALRDLRTEDLNQSVGNYGILDQIAALKWVRKNIHHFGGDPERITVFGQSAGACSVQALVSSPLTRGMIRNAIMQSGGGYDNGLVRDIRPEEAYKTGKKILTLLDKKNAQDLRRLPASDLVEILPQLTKRKKGLVFGPVVDGFVLQEGFMECMDNDNIHDIPYMLGVTANDISVKKNEDVRNSELYKGCLKFAEKREQYGGEPVYVYSFNRRLPGDDAGAFHSSELWYMFGTLDRCWRPMGRNDYILSRKMIDAWVSFMKTSVPEKGWQPCSKRSGFVRTFM